MQEEWAMAMTGKKISANGFVVTTMQEEEAASVELSHNRDKENRSTEHRDATAVTAKVDADASILTGTTSNTSPSNQNQPNRKVLSALSMFNSKSNAKAAGNATSEHDDGAAPAHTSWKSAPEESEASSANATDNNVVVVVQRPRGKHPPQRMQFGKFGRQPVVSTTTQLPMLLDTQGPLMASTRTPQRPAVLSPVAATPKGCGTAKFKSGVATDSSTRTRQRGAATRATPFLLGKLRCENPFASISSSTRRSTKKTKTTPKTTLSIITAQPMKFPEILDAMLAEATSRESKALFWACDGQAFGIDKTNHEAELAELLQTYFNHSKYSSLQRQLNIYGWKKCISGPFKGTYYNRNFHRDKSKSTDLSPIRRNVSPRTVSPRPPQGNFTVMPTRNSAMKRRSPTPSANPTAFASLESLTETPSERTTTMTTTTGRRLKLKISTKRDAPVAMPLIAGGTTTKRGRSKKPKTKRGATKRGKGNVHFDSSAIVTTTEPQLTYVHADPVKHRTVTPAFSCLETPEVEVESDLQRVAHSIYNGESRDSLECILGSACFESFYELSDMAPSPPESPPMMSLASKSLAFPHPAARIMNTKRAYVYQQQYDCTHDHDHSQLGVNTAPLATSKEDPFAEQRVQTRLGPPKPASDGFSQTVASKSHYFEQDCHTPIMSKQEKARRIAKDPSVEDFETLFGEEDLSRPQLMSSLLNHEKQMLQESTELPVCQKFTTTIFDAQGIAIDAEKKSKEVISPIDASAGGESRFSDEFFFYAEAPVTDSKNGESSLLAANSPMETGGVLQRRPILEVAKMRQQQSVPFALPMGAPSTLNHPGYPLQSKMQRHQMRPFSVFHQQQLNLSQQLQQQQVNSMQAFARQSLNGGVGQRSADPLGCYPQAPSGLMVSSGVDHEGQGGKFAAIQTFQRNNYPSNF